ncbi:MAG: hypothetical protein IJF78_09405 [Clostridia bacterium]|nr:hypothetical protein [Clostridia bacterium]
MKRLLPCLLLICMILTACTGNKTGETGTISIRDALQIKAYEYDKETNTYTQVVLALNEPIVIRHGGSGMNNINLQFCYEGGVCEVISDDEDIQLSIGQNGSYWASGDLGDYRTYGFSFTVGHEGYVSAHPVSARGGWFSTGAQPELRAEYQETRNTRNVGREYYMTVKAKDYDTTLITASLKLVQLSDIHTKPEDHIGDFTIELISYEYSDMYAIMEGAQ